MTTEPAAMIEPFPIVTPNLIYNASLMVDEGFGYALCLDKLVDTSESSNLCFKPFTPPLEAHLDIVWKKHHAFSKAAKKFISALKKNSIYGIEVGCLSFVVMHDFRIFTQARLKRSCW